MARPLLSRTLGVWMNGERVGAWTTRSGRPDEFRYASEWLMSGQARPISLSMPLKPAEYRGELVTAYFDNLLPDSRRIRERLGRRFGVSSARPFDLLAEIGRDCVGAIQLLPDDEQAPDVKKIEGIPVTAKQIERLLTTMLSPSSPGGEEGDDFRISLAGAQEKTALLRHGGKWIRPRGATPSTHILKLPIGTGGGGIDLRTSVENEWLCAEILRAFGVPVADGRMQRFGQYQVLVVERFDRRPSSDGAWIIRLPQEDMCQATGTPADRKYESDGGPGIRRVMDLLLGSSRAEQDRRDFFKTQMLFWMLCAIDGHAKNFSLMLGPEGAYRLAPRYDVLSAFPVLGAAQGKLAAKKVKMAMAVEGASRHYAWHTIQPRHWEEMARRCGIGSGFHALRDELIQTTPAVIDDILAKLPRDYPEGVANSIVQGLRRSCARLAAG
jgi:serine/threonine-protein kinase HipA